VISWFDFASEIHQQIKSNCKLLPISTEQFPTPAKRPKFSVMDKSKIQAVYSIQLKDWKESLKECIKMIPV
jgi:dTDP-4-dehydrorhamnose reductase